MSPITASASPTPDPRLLFEAALETRDRPAMRALLREGGLGSIPKQATRALSVALKHSDHLLVDLLLRAGANPSQPDDGGLSPISKAAQGNDLASLKLLLAAGASPNPEDDNPPLWRAVGNGNLQMMDVLISSGARLDRLDSYGATVLHWAATTGNEKVMLRLLKAGVPVNARSSNGSTPLHYAVRTGGVLLPTSAPLLVTQGADINARMQSGTTPAMEAVLRGDSSTFHRLVQLGADPLARDAKGRNVLDLAIMQRHGSLAMELLERYPGLTPATDKLDATLVDAVRSGATEVVKKLLALGADVGQKPGGRTLLQCAPRAAEELKRLLRAHKTGAAIESAMGDGLATQPRSLDTPHL